MADGDSQFKLRLPGELHALITDTAREKKRSINAEVVTRLEQSFVESSAETSVAQAVVEQDN